MSRLEQFDNPKVLLEQYSTEPEVAAQVLWFAYMHGDINAKVVADLGCGPGIFGIGAALLGAKKVFFVDKDEHALTVTRRNINSIKHLLTKAGLVVLNCDVARFEHHVDSVLQNPPFGTKIRHHDRLFLGKAFEVGNVVYSILTAHKEGKQSTGHALPPGEEIAAMPINIFFGTGEHTVDQMIASLERGLIVTRFHYINGLLDTRRALFTGMTRDGTFYVENGKIKYPVKNLRFTDSMLEAFSRVEMISKEPKLQLSYWYGANVVPALKIKDLNFSGKTEF